MRRRIVVLYGGRSAEHEISCISARSVMDALDPERYEAIPIGITRDGTWHLMSEPPALPSPGGELPSVRPEPGREVALDRSPGASSLVSQDGDRRDVDVVFPILHGPYGEDGTIQGMLELAGIPYVGAGVLSSAIGIDKGVQKVLFGSAGLPVGPFETVHEREWEGARDGVLERLRRLGMPLFAKPATLGSSVGISKVHDASELAAAMEEAFRYSSKSVVEASIEGAREIECAVLGNDDPVASLPGEILPWGEFYDYRSKYLEERTRLVIPAELPAEIVDEVRGMAGEAFRAIDCAGMARVDFFLRGEGDLLLNEINTIPGFTSVSMYPKLWEVSGLAYPDLIDRLVELALERHDRERKKGSGAS
jgi:D-alanine-D-alanine ligase